MAFYTQYDVSEQSQRYFKKVWCLDNSSNREKILEKSSLPNGCQNIAIIHGQGVTLTTRKTSFALSSGSFLTGQMTARVEVEIDAFTRIILIQLHPWTASNLFDLLGFTDEVREVDDAIFQGGVSLNHATTCCPKELANLLNRYCDKTATTQDFSLVERVCRQIDDVSFDNNVTNLMASQPYSKRTLQTAFKKATGLTIKQYADIIRLRSAVDSVYKNQNVSGAGVLAAVDHQFYDQSHLAKSFKRVVKVSPSKFDRTKFIMPTDDE